MSAAGTYLHRGRLTQTRGRRVTAWPKKTPCVSQPPGGPRSELSSVSRARSSVVSCVGSSYNSQDCATRRSRLCSFSALRSFMMATFDRALGTILLVACVFWAGFWAWFIGTAPRRAWAKRGEDIGAKQVVEFSDKGVHTVTANAESTTNWTVYTRLIERDGLYLLATKSRLLFRIFPRRAFESPGDEDSFRRLVGAHLPMA